EQMKKLYTKCDRLVLMLTILGFISLAISAMLLLIDWWEALIRPWGWLAANESGESTNIWFVFFLLLAIVIFLINIAVHKIRKDVAALLKEAENDKNKAGID